MANAPEAGRRPRISITKTQRANGPGAELLSLLQNVTADGIISPEEVHSLGQWLEANRSADLPSIAFLTNAVAVVLADGLISGEEQRDIFKAIEVALPPDARSFAVAARKEVEKRLAETVRRPCQTPGCPNQLPPGAPTQRKWCEECREVRAAPNVYREGDIPGFKLGFKLAGVAYEGRDAVVRERLNDGDMLALVRDASNPYDSAAIKVLLPTGEQVGFVPRGEVQSRYEKGPPRANTDLAALLDLGTTYSAQCWKVFRDGPVAGAFIVGWVDGFTKPSPARLAMAKENPDGGLAAMVGLRPSAAGLSVPEIAPPTPTARSLEQQSTPEPARHQQRTGGRGLLVAILLVLGMVVLAALAAR